MNVEGNRWLQQRFMCDTLSQERNREGETEREREKERWEVGIGAKSDCQLVLNSSSGDRRKGGRESEREMEGTGEQSSIETQRGRELGHGEGRRIMIEKAKRLEEGSGWWSSRGRKQRSRSEDEVEIGRLLDDVTCSPGGKERRISWCPGLQTHKVWSLSP